ncbi:H-NS family nucleoid-associated regulatory protein [Acinetobacter baumannii]
MSNEESQITQDNALTEQFKELLKDKDVSDIVSVIENLNAMADVKRKEDYLALYNEFEERVVALGFTSLPDFMVAIEAQGIVKTSRKERKKIDIRYKDPENPKNTWTGRGKQPIWLQGYIQQGRKIEDFLITAENEGAE